MKKIFIMLIVIIMLFGCVGETTDSCESTTPVITDVVFYTPTGDDFNPPHKSVFNVDDEFDIIIYATDCDLDIELLFMAYCISNCYTKEYILPPQVGVDRGYHFAKNFIMNVPIGFYLFEFWIEDGAGHSSNIVEVEIEVLR